MTEENGIPFFSNFELAAKREEQTKIFQQRDKKYVRIAFKQYSNIPSTTSTYSYQTSLIKETTNYISY